MKKALPYISIILFVPIVLIIWGFCLPCQYDATYIGALKYKQSRLKELNSPKIIIVGGSGMAFDVDSRLIDEAFPDYEVVNMGMYAALGSKAVLELTIPYINENDILIFAPENNPQTLSTYFGAEFAWQALDGAFYMLKDLSDSALLSDLILEYPHFASQKFRYWLTKTTPVPDSVYSRASFNEYGDIKVYLPYNTMVYGFDPNMVVTLSNEAISSDFIDYLNNCAQKVSDKKAFMYFAYCPAAYSSLYYNKIPVARPMDYHEFLTNAFSFEILGNPNNSILEDGWFYDTNFHLNSAGKTVFTRQLIKDLKAQLGDTSVTDIPLPDMPQFSPKSLLTENDLSAPNEITENDYAGNTEIESVTITSSVRIIRDYAFNGCTSLQEIHIQNSAPSSIEIGHHLLDGTNAYIYVPQDALSLYRTDYRFSEYAERIFPEK